jgi:sodium transport system permease protein
MNLRIARIIARKELLETLRDKRTLIGMIGIPVVLYPLLIIIVAQMTTLQAGRLERTVSRIAVDAGAPAELRQWIETVEKLELVEVDDPAAALAEGDIQAYVTVEGDFAIDGDGTTTIRIDYDITDMQSQSAKRRLHDAFREQGQAILDARLTNAEIDKAFIRPLDIEEHNVAPRAKQTGTFLGWFLPMMMIISIGVGAFYPAVDLTAGEKERGTYETLLSTPATRFEIVAGKFATIVCLSLLTGLLNLGSMLGSMGFALSQMSAGFGGESGFDLGAIQISAANVIMIVLTMIPLAFFICAVMMSIALLARDFREAQNYVTPFYIVILLPAMLAGVPGVELDQATQLIPIANVALLFKALLTGGVALQQVFVVVVSTAGCALLALVAAVWLFQREEVILAEEKGIPLALRRTAFVPRSSPTFGMALMLFAIALLLLFYVGSTVQSRDIISGLIITQWLLLALPAVALCWYVKIDLKNALSLRLPRPTAWPAAILIAMGLYILVMQIGVWQQAILEPPDAVKEQWRQLLEIDETKGGLLMMLFAFAVSPAICEELLFRGAILSGVRSKLSATGAIILVGLLFGLFHMDVYRLVYTALLGMGITYLVVRGGSIYLGMAAHLMVNATSVLLQSDAVPAGLLRWFEENNVEAAGFPAWLLAVAGGALIAGIVLMERAGRASAGGKRA